MLAEPLRAAPFGFMDTGTEDTMKVQIDDEVRDATPDEAARIKQISDEAAAQAGAIEAAAAAKVSARAKLKALGLTDAEIAALVG